MDSTVGEVMYLGQDFFNGSQSTGTIANADSWVTTTSPTYWGNYWQHTKIRLKLSEVEHLRAAARTDKKLRKVLKKFAPYIEVEVDFPGGD